jgi:excisionase family DNA binding protein
METSSLPPSHLGLEPMIDVRTLAEYLGVPVSTVYDWRLNRKGPVGYRFGKHIMFAVADVRAWVEEQRESSPSGRASHAR